MHPCTTCSYLTSYEANGAKQGRIPEVGRKEAMMSFTRQNGDAKWPIFGQFNDR